MDTLGLDGISERQTKPSILIGEFSEHVIRLHRDADRGFEEEYWTLPDKPLMLYTSAKLRCNRVKNRFDNVFPYDNSRVKLSPLPGLEGSDYINASFLDGYNKENAYIAAQGPLKGTVGDFWRMVWEYKLFTIIMLTETVEAGRDKCEQYWPSSINESWNVGGSLTVTLVEQRPYAEYKVKILTVEDLSQPEPCPFTVTHYHFSAWPDHGVPADKTCLIHFIQRVRKAHPYENSISLLVHCSAGVGRTGTFMVLDSMLQRMKTETSLNIYEFLYQLRTKRILMVQTPIQYSFIHDALEEFITCGDTSIAVSSIRTAVEKLDGDTKTSYTEQFQLLNEVAYKADAVNCSYGETEENKEKNRYHDKLPYNQTRVILRGTAVKGSDYINASFVDGYKQRRAYIATQAPLESTANDFWRMMWEHKSRTIVMLCDLTEDDSESSYQYWPTDTENPVVYGKLKVEMTSEDTSGELTTRKFELTQDNPSPMTGAPKSAVITQFHHTAWPKGGQQLSPSPVLKLINALIKTQMTTGNHSITVMCNDGVGRTGCFICVYSELEKIKVEGITDVFQYIKASRFQRPGLVSTVEQYKFCHTVLVDFVDTFDNYANFKVL